MTNLCATRPTRLGFLATGLAATLGWALSPALRRHLAAAEGPTPRARRCVLIWPNGGPSHIDTFDPKPGTEAGGPFAAIETAVPGRRLSEHLPRLAARADRLAVVRSLASKEADHERAYRCLHTGNPPQETVEFPSLGPAMDRHRSGAESPLPSYVAINGEGPSPGFFGQEFAP